MISRKQKRRELLNLTTEQLVMLMIRHGLLTKQGMIDKLLNHYFAKEVQNERQAQTKASETKESN